MESLNNKKEPTKSLQEKSFIMDINIIEAPFFLFNKKEKGLTVEQLLSSKDTDLSNQVTDLLNKKLKDAEVKYNLWVDSKGNRRELLAISNTTDGLPRGFAMDVWYGLIGLFIKKNSPIYYNNGDKVFNIETDQLEFSFYELAKFMNLSISGRTFSKIKSAIEVLYNTDYYSLQEGAFYIKETKNYLSDNRGFKLIVERRFTEVKDDRKNIKESKNSIIFNKMVISNLKYEYVKYLNSNIYFKLPSGLSRKIYSYVEGNKFNSNGEIMNYIKRSYKVLANKIPIDYRYNSDLRITLSRHLNNLVKIGLVKDFFFGDKDLIDNKKEESVYIIFKGTKEEVIEKLNQKNRIIIEPEIAITEEKETLNIPSDMKDSLLELGVSESEVIKWIADYSEEKLIKYYLWIKQQQIENKKIENAPALLSFALSQNLAIPSKYSFIDELIESHKKEKDNKKATVEERYKKYIQDEFEKFKNENKGMYSILSESWIEGIKDQYGKLYDNNLLMDNDLRLYNEFLEKESESELFNKIAVANIKIMNNLMTFDDFIFNNQ